VALGYRILIDVYKTMKFQVPYKDVGAEVVYQRKTKNREQAMIRSLERSGYVVTKVAPAQLERGIYIPIPRSLLRGAPPQLDLGFSALGNPTA
jgi:hypothetical protein